MRKTRQSQVDSYTELKESGTLSRRQDQIYKALKEQGMATNRMIAKHLGWDINRVTGRVTELVNLGKIDTAGNYLDKETNRTVTLWKCSK